MSYIGRQPLVGAYSKVDDVSASFNGSTTTFPINVAGVATAVGNAQSILISVNGVIQEPGSSYSISGTNIVFTEAPTAGMTFFAIILGNTLNIGVPSDGTVTPAKLNLVYGAGGIPFNDNVVIGQVQKDTAYVRTDLSNVSGTMAIDYTVGPVIKATATGAVTSITTSNWPASGTVGHLRLFLVNFGAYTITFPTAWKWVKSDLTLTTTFADLGITLPAAGLCIVDLITEDGGTTVYAYVARN